MIRFIFATLIGFLIFFIVNGTKTDATINLRLLGLHCEEHEVFSIGNAFSPSLKYRLSLVRLPRTNGIPVLLMHGFGGSSDNWSMLGRNRSAILYDHGYDVWMGNFRGNSFSIGPRPPSNICSESFWDFSMDEMISRDMPAMVDYIIEKTNQTSLHFIGHSMANSIFLGFLASNPKYNKKFISGALLAPVVYPIKEFRGTRASIPVRRRNEIALASSFLHIYSIPPRVECLKGAMRGIGWANRRFGESLRNALFPPSFHNFRSGTSVKTFKHIATNIAPLGGKHFNMFDYKRWKNIEMYGGPNPPEYIISQVTVPLMLAVAESDTLTDNSSINELIKNLKWSDFVVRMIPEDYNHEKFYHGSFVDGFYAKELVYDPLIEFFKEQEDGVLLINITTFLTTLNFSTPNQIDYEYYDYHSQLLFWFN